jgi:probable DNA metabolism protein
MTHVASAHDFASFRAVARGLIERKVRPEEVAWVDPASQQTSLFGEGDVVEAAAPTFKVSRRFVELAELASLYRSDDRFALLYRVLYRLAQGSPRLLDDELDPDVHELIRRVKSVRHDEHRMHAFVRFRRSETDGVFVAWYRPEHLIVPLTAPFFQRRFAAQSWSILTPDESAYWDGEALRYGPGAPRSEAPEGDELEALFRTYYRSTFNPARMNLRLFRQHVPQDFQREMPELTVLDEMASAAKRKVTKEAAETVVPASRALSTLREAAASCRACPLGDKANQTVFGEGKKKARLVMVGEQPGDQEDRQGHPFVGPAGQMLDRALLEAGIARDDVYLTNAVKHFNYRPLGKKRLHQKPEWSHIEACRPWLRAELEAVKPDVILCLGATAAQSFLGRRFTVIKNRGRVFDTPWAKAFLVSYHPSAILRAPDEDAREQTYQALVHDLRAANRILEGHAPKLESPD